MAVRCIVQARYNSKRLPGKALAPIGGAPLTQHIVDRLRAGGFDYLFALADEGKTHLLSYVKDHDLPFMVGDEKDVLARFIEASADLANEDYIIRLTGDNPFVDYKALQTVIAQLDADLVYATGLPIGTTGGAVKVRVLRDQLQQKLGPAHREHVITFLKEHPEKYSHKVIDVGAANLPIRLTIDEEADLATARAVFEAIDDPLFCYGEIAALYARQPDLFAGNQDVEQKSAQSHE